MDLGKLKGDCFQHVEPFYKILEEVNYFHPGILSNGHCVVNADNTNVSVEFGRRVKILSNS